jgi:hypothetical protein
MLEAIKSLFFKEKKKTITISEKLNNISIGQVLRIKFKDPRKLGLIDPSSSLTKRYDLEDLEKRVLIGTLLTKRVVNEIFFLELGCFKMRNGMRVERTYTLMLEEIEHVEEVK